MTTQELTKEVGDIKPQLARVEEKIDNCCDRLQIVEHDQKEQGKMLIIVERLANGVEYIRKDVTGLNGKVDKVAERVECIEGKPAKRWDALVTQIITLVVAAGFGYLLSRLIP